MFLFQKLVLTIFMLTQFHFSANAWVAFYHETGFKGLLQNQTHDETHTSCINLNDGVRQNVSSIRAHSCLILYFQPNCLGDWTKCRESDFKNLHSKNNKIVSFRFCRPEEAFWKSLDVKFFTGINFQGGSFGYENIDESCRNLVAPSQRTSHAIRNSKCIVLFDQVNCEGNSKSFTPGAHENLDTFNAKTVSFRSCPSVANTTNDFINSSMKYRLKLYRNESFDKLIFDKELISDVCYEKLSHFNVYSLESTAPCLTLFTEKVECMGEPNFTIPYGNLSKLPREMRWGNVKSFRMGSAKCNNDLKTPLSPPPPTVSQRMAEEAPILPTAHQTASQSHTQTYYEDEARSPSYWKIAFLFVYLLMWVLLFVLIAGTEDNPNQTV